MKHKEWELLSAFLDGELAASERAEVSTHLASCTVCAQEFSALAVMEKSAASSPRHVMPPALLARLEGMFSRPTWTEHLYQLLPAPRISIPVGAFATLAVALSFWMVYPEQDQIPLESLLAAHTRYSAEGLMPQENLAHPEFITHLSAANVE